ncbi:MAG: cell division protein SepF, partial [Acidimicrobiales bacterium]
AKMYLGLGPDEDYDDYASGPIEPVPPQPVSQQQFRQPATGQTQAVRPVAGGDLSLSPGTHSASVRTIPSSTSPQQPSDAAPAVAQQPLRPVASGASVVRTIPASSARAKPEVVAPRNFNDAQKVADTFKANNAVIVNLQAVDGDLSRRIIDFSAGLCYGLGGQMEKVTQAVYMLTPDDVEVSAEDRRDAEQGLHR